MRIAGYEIRGRIGEGGMATAYLAIQVSLGRQVVLKILDTSHVESKAEVERFLNEGRIVATLNHPHIITVYDIGISEDCVYLSMEYVEGGDLKSRIETGRFEPREILDLILKIAGALEVAHQNGIIHRDVKPGNILFRRDGTPLLSDFGIAKQITLDRDLTQTGIFLGSPNYMAPEQAESGPIDGRVDIYALGVIFYEMLTGEKPFRSESVIDVIWQHKQAPIPKLPPEHARFQPLLELMMAKNRKDRFRDCASLIHYVRQLLAQESARAVADKTVRLEASELATAAPAPAAPVYELPRRRGGRVRGALLALLALCAAAFFGLSMAERRLNAPPELERGPPPPLPPAQVAMAPAGGETGTTGMDEVKQALTWLGQRSLEEYRLTSPDRDNAYYYFSRLMQIDPGNPTARQGLAQVAEKFAYLAEEALARDDAERAQGYIAVGLQVDPENRALRDLRKIARPDSGGLLRALKGMFGSA